MRKPIVQIVRLVWFVKLVLFPETWIGMGWGTNYFIVTLSFITARQWTFWSLTRKCTFSQCLLGIAYDNLHPWFIVFQKLLSSNYVLGFSLNYYWRLKLECICFFSLFWKWIQLLPSVPGTMMKYIISKVLFIAPKGFPS